jgi:hypothetical protein
MSTRARKDYNRRALAELRWGGREVFGVSTVTFGEDSGEGLLVVQLAGTAVVRATTDTAVLQQWPLYRYTAPDSFGAIVPIALEPLSPTAEGSRFQLRFAQLLGSLSGTWKLLIPADSPHVQAVSGAPLRGWQDPQHISPPSPALPWSIVLDSFGSVSADNWTLAASVGVSGSDWDVDTGSPANSPFGDLSVAGLTMSDGNSVVSVVDLGAGVLRFTCANPVAANTAMIASNGGGPLSASGARAAASFVLS